MDGRGFSTTARQSIPHWRAKPAEEMLHLWLTMVKDAKKLKRTESKAILRKHQHPEMLELILENAPELRALA